MSYGSIKFSDTAKLVLAANCNRQEAWVTNLSETYTAYIGPDASISTYTAMPLFPYQGYNKDRTFGAYLGDIYATAATVAGRMEIRYWEEEGR